MGLTGCSVFSEGVIDFNKLTDTALHIALGRIYTPDVEKLKFVVWSCHILNLYCC